MEQRFSSGEEFKEEEIRVIIKRLILAVNYIQNQNTVHRDIKPENVLLERPNDLSSIKLADFGLSIKAGFEKTMSLNVKCGTPAYMAPEMFIDNTYTKVIDMWSIGVIFYRLLNKGKIPFTKDELKKLARNTDLSVEDKFSDIQVSRNCMHLLRKLLEPNDLRRMPSYHAYKHPYLSGEDNREPALMMFEIEEAYTVRCNLKKVAAFDQGVQLPTHLEEDS